MATKIFIGNSDVARNVKAGYIGVDGVARRIIKGFIGVNGLARPFFNWKAASKDETLGVVNSGDRSGYRHGNASFPDKSIFTGGQKDIGSNRPSYSAVNTVINENFVVTGNYTNPSYNINYPVNETISNPGRPGDERGIGGFATVAIGSYALMIGGRLVRCKLTAGSTLPPVQLGGEPYDFQISLASGGYYFHKDTYVYRSVSSNTGGTTNGISVGNYAMFANGTGAEYFTENSSSASLPSPLANVNTGAAKVANYGLFVALGDNITRVVVYTTSLTQLDLLYLSSPQRLSISTSSTENNAWFAGGYDITGSTPSNVVDSFNENLVRVSEQPLASARCQMAGSQDIADFAMFAGGTPNNSYEQYSDGSAVGYVEGYNDVSKLRMNLDDLSQNRRNAIIGTVASGIIIWGGRGVSSSTSTNSQAYGMGNFEVYRYY